LHAERVGERLECMLGRAIAALQGYRAIGHGTAHVDDRAAMLAKVPHGGTRAVHLTPVVDLHLAPEIVDRHVHQPAIDRHRGVIDPRVDTFEFPDRGGSDAVDLRGIRYIGDRVHGATAAPTNSL